MELSEYEKMDRLESSHPWFVAKRDFLLMFLRQHLPAPAKILDIGCGTGAIMSALQSEGYDIDGVDPSAAALEYCRRKGLAAIEATAEDTEQEDGSFDGVISLDVLEHLASDKDGVDEMLRILKPGGIAIVTVPAHQSLFSAHDRELHHFRRYDRSGLKRLFSKDFELLKITWLHSFILVPLALKRRFQGMLKRADSSSDVKESGRAVTAIISAAYALELAWLKIFGALPWGLSLMIIVRKN